MNKYFDAVDANHQLILDAHDYIWSHAETGYREWQTSKYLEDAFEKLGYELVRAGDIPGFYTVLDTGRPGPELLILGELDALLVPDHPEKNPETGAAHSCGHSAQSAALLGVAAALKQPGVLDELCGRIRLCAVPAEELIEIQYRSSLKKDGVIHYMGGKSEFLYRGYFDGVDLAFMVHTTNGDRIHVRRGSVGCVAKRIVYKGVATHAGGSPWLGCNALYAANLGLNAINAIRETFREPDMIRVHPIITHGGDAVNAIPDNVVIESYVRGRTFDAIAEVNKKVNRALCGAALSLGANVDIQDMPGYAPLVNSDGMMKLARDAGEGLLDTPVDYQPDAVGSGSTDMGDLSTIMPVVHPYMPGAVGQNHGIDYYVRDVETACVTSAKYQMSMLSMLLSDGAARAKAIVADYKPLFSSKEEYFKYVGGFTCDGDRIAYEDNVANITL